MTSNQEIQHNEEVVSEAVQILKTQLDEVPKDLELDFGFFYYQPINVKKHLIFKFDSSRKIKEQIRKFIIQADASEVDVKDTKCHIEYYHFTNQWVVLGKHTKSQDFQNESDYKEIRLRFH